MTSYSKTSMKDLLAQGLYILILQKPFEKITIKQICDKTGVIRGTFYNHFMDKYEALEYLCESLLMKESEIYLKKNDYRSFIKHTLSLIQEHKDFFYKGLQIEGQNNFGEMIHKVYKKALIRVIRQKQINLKDTPISIDLFTGYHSATLVLMIRNWIERGCNESCDDVMKTIDYFYTNNLYDFIA